MIRLTRLQKVQEKKRFYRCWNDVIMAFSNIRMQERYQAVSDCPSNAFVRPFLLHCNKYELYLSLVTLAVQSTTLSVVSKRMSSPGMDTTLRDIGTCRTLTLHYNLQDSFNKGQGGAERVGGSPTEKTMDHKPNDLHDTNDKNSGHTINGGDDDEVLHLVCLIHPLPERNYHHSLRLRHITRNLLWASFL